MRTHSAATVIVVALATGMPAAAEAAVVYRCRAADGVIAWRDIPCLPGEASLARREFAPAATPSPQSNRAGPRRAESGLREPAVPRADPRKGTAAAARGAGRVVAHECRFGEQRWVQAESCPSRLAQAGESGAVDETRLTSGDVCAALRHASAGTSRASGSSRRAYAMNRLRQRHGC